MQQTLDQLKDLKLNGFIEAWQEQQTQPTYQDLSFVVLFCHLSS